jgi:hypothetical protein
MEMRAGHKSLISRPGKPYEKLVKTPSGFIPAVYMRAEEATEAWRGL